VQGLPHPLHHTSNVQGDVRLLTTALEALPQLVQGEAYNVVDAVAPLDDAATVVNSDRPPT